MLNERIVKMRMITRIEYIGPEEIKYKTSDGKTHYVGIDGKSYICSKAVRKQLAYILDKDGGRGRKEAEQVRQALNTIHNGKTY